MNKHESAHPFYGFGLGLRIPHYGNFEAGPQPVDWLEVITDNFLIDGGKPLHKLMRFREDYPIALHGVAMSIGTAQGVDKAYLRAVKALADRVEPMWISDHLCWSGLVDQPLHDLYPLPYTEECARLIVSHIEQVQDVLGRRLVLENVSSYIRYTDSQVSEWDFLRYIADTADCDLLVDVNNIYVSSVNHGFNPLDYLDAMPRQRVRQIHLAGHSYTGDFIIDTHDHPIIPEVWALYAQACERFGAVATMIERDDHIPPLSELLAELNHARCIAAAAGISTTPTTSKAPATARASVDNTAPASSGQGQWSGAPMAHKNRHDLDQTQQKLGKFILNSDKDFSLLVPHVVAKGEAAAPPHPAKIDGERGLEIYHHAYRARLKDTLADSFRHLTYYMGEHFEAMARAYVEAHPPLHRPLSRYGDSIPAFLRTQYPDDIVLAELAELEWALRTRFDCADVPAWTLDAIERQGVEDCLQQSPVLHPSLLFLTLTTNAAAIWLAIKEDAEVPPVEKLESPTLVTVWRWGLQPHFMSLEGCAGEFLQALLEPQASINSVTEIFTEAGKLTDPEEFAGWLRSWWEMEILLKHH